ncbi:MAG: hypothetical protein KKF48_02480 [Nanoarchaeota archaeon]|nr:hypothetical protein [Nanoarchaeota archaeon]MBU1027887.1 hypothetical protein [Nanoarchaeota archaeon]
MNNKKLTGLEKNILIAEAVFVFGILIYLFFFTGPNQIFPFQGMSIIEPDFVFQIENGEKVMLSVDKEFTNPIELGQDSEILLPPGVYYWKAVGFLRESEVRSFTIQSHVGLNLKERKENYELQNAGNVDLEVTKTNGDKENFDLDVGDNLEFEKSEFKIEGSEVSSDLHLPSVINIEGEQK